jgi:raffinose/stachyose/melibiose transport system substrate-binding protein
VKKILMLTLAAVMLMSIIAGCSSNTNNSGAANNTQNQGNAGTEPAEEPKKDVTIKYFNFKVEIAEALNEMVKEYEAETGVKVEVETVGGGADYGAALKAKLAAGEEPEIFNNGGFKSLELYMDRATDLSGEPWVGNVVEAAKTPTTVDGKLYGMPMNIEGYGFLYNKDLFAQAGITEAPDTLTELRAAAQALKDAGITPFANGYQEWWILGIHNLNVGLAQQDNTDEFIANVNAGTATFAGNEIFQDWANLLDTTVEFGNSNPLTTDYNTQVTLFASGEAAMMQQGNWTQVQIDEINPDINIGVLPMPINDSEKAGSIYVGVPNNYIVNSKSAHPEEAKAFLNWMVSSDAGKRYMIEDFKFIPAFTNIEFTPEQLGDIAAAIQEYNQAGKALSWNWDKLPDGSTQEFGAAIQAYIAGNTTVEEMLASFDKAVANLTQ